MIYVVSVSGGAGSTLALERAIEKHGIDNVVAVFADTNTEHEDLYDLLNHIKTRHPSLSFVWLDNDGMDIWDCFDKYGMISTPNGACKASLELKQKPIAKWVKENCDPKTHVICSGLEFSEPERMQRFDARWEPYTCWHPLADAPLLSDCQIIDAVSEFGYPDQTLYERRYPHNNCGGGCVLAGIGQWAGFYQDDPDRFDYHLQREKQFNELHRQGKREATILKDRSTRVETGDDGNLVLKSDSRPMSLETLVERVHNNDVNLRDFRTACGCMLGEQGNLFDLLKEDDGCF